MRYQSGEEIKKSDCVLFHRKPAKIELGACDPGDPETDWLVEEYGGGVLILEGAAGRTFIPADQIADYVPVSGLSARPSSNGAGPSSTALRLPLVPTSRPIPVHKDSLDARPRPKRFFQQVDTLDDETPFLPTRTAAPYQAPQPLDPLVPIGKAAHTFAGSPPEEGSVAATAGSSAAGPGADGPRGAGVAVRGRASRASSTSFEKAASSRTAMSASTLRSRATSAAFKPAIKRL